MREVPPPPPVLVWCDRCWARDETRVPSAGEWTVAAIEGNNAHPTPKILDFCEACATEVKELAGLVFESPILPNRHKLVAPVMLSTKLRTVPCPVCRVEVNRASLVGHIWANHRTTARPAMPLTCVECGATYESPQGIATHRRLTHGYDAVVDALSGVKGYKVTGKEGQL